MFWRGFSPRWCNVGQEPAGAWTRLSLGPRARHPVAVPVASRDLCGRLQLLLPLLLTSAAASTESTFWNPKASRGTRPPPRASSPLGTGEGTTEAQTVTRGAQVRGRWEGGRVGAGGV